MKRALFLSLGLLILVTVAASAENSLEAKNKALVFSTSSSTALAGKYMLASDMAVNVSVGYMSAGISGSKSTLLSIGGGVAKYLKTEDVAPYVGAGVGFGTSSPPVGDSQTTFSLAGIFGVEAFIMKNVSVSGNAQLGFSSISNWSGTKSYSTMGTAMTAFMVTIYLP
ncbi:MAG: hypothetical protein QME66_12365 [Candidatus Eisenbacteria bacterium]|nr:hypothetical protein [Candidatus Eisenbacteria bacterium]